ncbi:MAG: PKD domain-containing protein [Solirubrobacteraceae bacterium]|nr:PKD domain-containing protein [Solirubrobacteraceae bacterium]
MTSHLVRLLTLLAVVAGSIALPSSASARYITIPASFHHETVIYGENGNSCAAVSFVRWAAPSYAESGSGLATFTFEDGSSNSARTAYAKHPEYHDRYAFGDSYFQSPPAGSHQAVISQSWSIGDPTVCGEMLSKAMGWLSNPRAEIWVDDQPRASFTAKEKTYEPGAFDFTATSVSPVGRPLLHDWEFGDEAKAQQDTIVHRYEKPGYYRVKLTATDPSDAEADLRDTETQTVYVAPPSLSASIMWDEDLEVAGRLPLDEPVDVTVRIRAGRGVGNLSDLTFNSDRVLQAYDGGDLIELEAEKSPAPFTLAPDEYRDFKATVTPRQLGELRLETGITGTDAAGNDVSDSPQRYVKLGQDLEVTVTPDPSSLELEYDEQADEITPEPVKLAVKVRNLTGQTIDNAKLDLTAIVRTQVSRDPSKPRPLVLLTYTDRDGKTQSIPATTAGGQIARDLEIGEIGPDETLNLAVGAQAQDQARVRVTGIVRGVVDDEDGGRREAAGSGRADVRIGQPTLLRVLPDNSATAVQKAGGVWSLSSTIENISPSENVTVRVLTHKIGNTVGKPVDDALAPTPENALGLVKELEPGERLLVGGKFSSDPNGGTRSIVDLMVDGWVVDVDTGEKRELLTDEIAVLDQPNGDPATRRRVAIDTSSTVKADWTYSEVGWYFTDGFARGFGRWVDSTVESGQSLALGTAHAATWMFYLPSTVVKYMQPGEAEQALKEISADLATSYAKLKQVSYAQARAAVDQQLQTKLLPILESYETGDVEKLASQSGELLGEAAPDLIIDAATSVIAAERLIAKSAKTVLTKADDAQEATKASRIAAKGIRGFEPGDAVEFAQAERYWGLDHDLYEKLRQYVQDNKIVVSMRERSPGSIERLARGALGKIEKVKAKNVNRVDVDYLGFAEDHMDFAMFKQMPPWKVVEQRVLANNPGATFWERRELMAKVKARWSDRAKEFVKESEAMADYAKAGAIDVPNKKWGLNPNGNFEADIEYTDVWDKREFKLAEAGADGVAATTDGLPAFQPQVYGETLVDGKMTKGLKPLTGDMDLIAIVDRNGKLLDEDTRMQVYRDLGAMGFQHPESLTWNNVSGRKKYLGDFDVASGKKGQSLLAFLPDGTLGAIKLDSRKWWVETTQQASKGFALLQGMRMSWGEPDPEIPQTQTSEALPAPGSVPPDDDGRQPYPGPPTGDGDGASFDSSDDAPLLRPNLDGSTSQWDPNTGRWTPVSAPPPGKPVRSVPQTGLTQPTEPGDSRLPIIEQGKLGLAPEGKSDWFKPGDSVVVDPGGKNQETVTVARLGSIITAAPTTRPHRAGELVAVMPKARPVGGGAVTPTPVPTSAPDATPTPAPTSVPDAKPDPAPAPPIGGASPTPPPGTGPRTATPVPLSTTLVRPSSGKAPKLVGSVRVGRAVTCSTGTWSGSTPLRYAYAWETRSGKRWKALKGQTKPKLTVPANTARRQLRCSVTAANGAGQTTRSSTPRTVAAKVR